MKIGSLLLAPRKQKSLMYPKMHTSSWICLQLETHFHFSWKWNLYIPLYSSSSRDGITVALQKFDPTKFSIDERASLVRLSLNRSTEWLTITSKQNNTQFLRWLDLISTSPSSFCAGEKRRDQPQLKINKTNARNSFHGRSSASTPRKQTGGANRCCRSWTRVS